MNRNRKLMIPLVFVLMMLAGSAIAANAAWCPSCGEIINWGPVGVNTTITGFNFMGMPQYLHMPCGGVFFGGQVLNTDPHPSYRDGAGPVPTYHCARCGVAMIPMMPHNDFVYNFHGLCDTDTVDEPYPAREFVTEDGPYFCFECYEIIFGS
jgi:hypothetical protein